jgi:hypothetical protein
MWKEWLLCNLALIIYDHEDLFFAILLFTGSFLCLSTLVYALRLCRSRRLANSNSNSAKLLDLVAAPLVCVHRSRACRLALFLMLCVPMAYFLLSSGRCDTNDCLVAYLQCMFSMH